jgi:hypothetical protein
MGRCVVKAVAGPMPSRHLGCRAIRGDNRGMIGSEQVFDEFIDIDVQNPRIRLRWITAGSLCWVAIILLSIIIANTFSQYYDRLVIGIGGFGPCVVTLIVLSTVRARHLRTIRRLAAAADPKACARFVAEQFGKGNGAYVTDMVNALVRARRANVTIRMGPTNRVSSISPLANPFGPLLLNESEPAFIQLEDSIDTPEARDKKVPTSLRDAVDESTTARTIIRNVRLNGGWFVVAFVGFFLAMTAVVSLLQRQLIWGLGLFSIILLGVLFISPISGGTSARQLLLVPGGLLLRRAATDPRRSRLHLFRREDSVLCVAQLRRPAWLLQVRDGKGKTFATVTERESKMLLRAWLSPLEPPPVEKLVDLT